MQDGRVYMVPRLFPNYKIAEIQKHGCVFDLCLYKESLQTNTAGKLINFYVLDSDARSRYPPHQIWSTSKHKRAIGSTIVYETIDVTPIYANKIKRWYTKRNKERAAKFISHMLFEIMMRPSSGWLYRRSLKSWESQIK